MVDEESQLHTLGLLEQLRQECKGLWGASSEAYFRVEAMLRQLANPNLHDILRNTLRAACPLGHRRVGECRSWTRRP
jgi:hypothetical protein